MRALIAGLCLAGVVQLVIIIANFVMPKKLSCRKRVSRISPMIREGRSGIDAPCQQSLHA